jgi:hypothetical protein
VGAPSRRGPFQSAGSSGLVYWGKRVDLWAGLGEGGATVADGGGAGSAGGGVSAAKAPNAFRSGLLEQTGCSTASAKACRVFSAARLWQGGQGRAPVGLRLGLVDDLAWCLCASISRNDVRLSDGCAWGGWLCLDGALPVLTLAAR